MVHRSEHYAVCAYVHFHAHCMTMKSYHEYGIGEFVEIYYQSFNFAIFANLKAFAKIKSYCFVRSLVIAYTAFVTILTYFKPVGSCNGE